MEEKKKVQITVRGLQCEEDGSETVTETAAAGEYYEKNGSRYVIYEEIPEETGRTVRNIIKLKECLLELTRRGAALDTRMVLEQGRTHRTGYATPYGLLEFDVRTDQIDCREQDDVIEILAQYELLGGMEDDCRTAGQTAQGLGLRRLEIRIEATKA